MSGFKFVGTLNASNGWFTTNMTDLALRRTDAGLVLLGVTHAGNGGISTFAIPDAARLGSQSAQVPYPPTIGMLQEPRLLVLGDGIAPEAYVVGVRGSGTMGIDLDATGRQTGTGSLPLPGDVLMADSLTLAGRTYVVASCASDAKLRTYLRGPGDSLSLVATGTAPMGVAAGARVTDITTARVGEASFVLATSTGGNFVSAQRIGADGNLGPAQLIGMSNAAPFAAPRTMQAIETGGSTFVVVGGNASSSMTVMRLGADGRMTMADHILDELGTRFSRVNGLDTVTVGGRGLVFAGGADDGLSMFTLLANGRLVHLASFADRLDTPLQDIVDVSAQMLNGKIALFAVSGTERGIAQFEVDPGNVGVTAIAGSGAAVGTSADDSLVASANTTRIDGGGGNDILAAGTRPVVLAGGAGADLFIPTAVIGTVTIADFEPGLDRLDLSDLGMVRSIGQMRIQSTSAGLRLSFGATVIEIRSAKGDPLPVSLIGNDCFPVAHYQTPGTSSTLVGTAKGEMLTAGAGAIIAYGMDGDDTLEGGYLADQLLGGPGNDRAVGRGGPDWMAGGFGNDTLSGNDGNDTLLGEDGSDLLAGGTGDDRVQGGIGEDTLIGEDGNDLLLGEDWNDLLVGGVGNDTLQGGLGNDVSTGGPGNDLLIEIGGLNRMVGEDGNDTALGGADADFLVGGWGLDLLWGRGGNDTLLGGSDADTLMGGLGDDDLWGEAGNDRLLGEEGADRVFGGPGDDVMLGGLGNDIMSGEDGADLIDGQDGNDYMIGGNGADTLTGGAGFDSLRGDAGDDLLFGLGEHDRLFGLDGNDVLWGGIGNDTLWGGIGVDDLRGETGDDSLGGEADNDQLWGGEGRDTLAGGLGNDQLNGGADADLILGNEGLDTLVGWSGNDTIISGWGADWAAGGLDADTLWGEDGNDTLYGEGGNDLLHGGLGDDMLAGGTEADRLYGDEGNDRLYGSAGNDSLWGGIGTDVLAGEEADDYLDGGDGDDHLTGGIGADTLFGNLGNDVLIGGAGPDRLAGGAGADRFVFAAQVDSPAYSGWDTIEDFQRGSDRIDLRGMHLHLAASLDGSDRALAIRGAIGGVEVVVDLDGNGMADLRVRVIGASALGAGDFLL